MKIDQVFIGVEGAGTKVDELQLECVEVDQYVLILNVAMQHAFRLHLEHRVDDLPKEQLGQLVIQRAIVIYVVPQVNRFMWTFHENQIAILSLYVVENFNAALAAQRLIHQLNLKRYPCGFVLNMK